MRNAGYGSLICASMLATGLSACALPSAEHGANVEAAAQSDTPVAQPVFADISRPNILVILADDLGYPDVSAYNSGAYPTPNIDRLASTGVAFTNGYVAASVCAVSRAGLLTGRAPASFGFTYNITENRPADANAGIPTSVETIAERLQRQHYNTAAFGKWHLGTQAEYYPTNRGFDEFFGFLAGESIYADPDTPGLVTTPTKDGRKEIELRHGNHRLFEGAARQPVAIPHRYLTFEITGRTLDFIDRSADKHEPFFAYAAYNAPHWPLQVPQEYYDRVSHIKDPVRRTYVAMIAALDHDVGRLLDRLEERGLRDNTMIVFLSDNGCPDFLGFCDNSNPFGSGKFTYLEGGTRVPFILSWPAGLHRQGKVDTPVSSLDLAPTIMAAASPEGAPFTTDGENVVPMLAGDTMDNRDLFWSQAPVSAIRHGRYKLWHSQDWNETRLFDLAEDPWERTDVSARHPEIRATLQERLRDYNDTLPEPLWPLHGTRKVTIAGRETEWVH
ncbi:sulfatase-like hydrolase/transferase [Altericroceibacterium endophyticum]|uniref:Sulfatase-like hydrolase/transferase n=1 Tax=Altericroceibacterium endophyticum TaxID=1808508 RepID=A0A6I4T3V1_9SPHN|nr:sulfatase-like hydrolase/transferase [Altericroceibacterium endophyticum]MXO64942.1 sulfatase-like hydrolase/transferase [Altericroceibacterium endophyticum]